MSASRTIAVAVLLMLPACGKHGPSAQDRADAAAKDAAVAAAQRLERDADKNMDAAAAAVAEATAAAELERKSQSAPD